jgi:hypothetical protein
MANVRNKNLTSKQYGAWLGSHQDWTYWVTLTTRYELTLQSARRLTDKFYKEIARAGDSRIFWAAEPFDTKEGHHVHAMLKVSELLPFSYVINSWQVATGNRRMEKKKWNRIDCQKYNPKLGAAHYCGKYITKNLSDYDYLGK